MIEAKEIKLQDVFTSNTSLVIPFFQRKYVWEEDNWNDLWEGILSLYENPDKAEYFMGNLLFKNSKPYSSDNELEVIDGQQRLITISILLKALEDLCDSEEEKHLRSEIGQLLRTANKEAQAIPRMMCSLFDKDCYRDIISCKSYAEVSINCARKYKSHKILKCYDFFRELITKPGNEEQEIDRERMLRSLISSDKFEHKGSQAIGSISFVRIGLKDDDDEQEIFDTMNSLGKSLKTSELVKNYLFRQERFEDKEALLAAYDEFWKDVFETEDNHNWWQSVASKKGLKTRNNLDMFLHSFLTLTTKRNNKIITMEDMFPVYKKLIDKQSKSKKINALLRDIKEHAEIYRKYFIQVEDIEHIKYSDWNTRLFLTVGIFRSTSVYPLILYYYQKHQDEADREQFANEIINFLVRRTFCGLTGKNYNYLFPQAVHDMDKEGESFARFIGKYDTETRRFPDDDDFYRALLTSSNTKEDHWKLLLHLVALKQLDNGRMDIDSLDYSHKVEHILPKAWDKTTWNRSRMDDDEIDEYNAIVNVLGNVVLVPKSWSKPTSKKVWPDKKKVLEIAKALPNMDQHLEVNIWNKDSVIKRSEELYKEILKIMPNIIK